MFSLGECVEIYGPVLLPGSDDKAALAGGEGFFCWSTGLMRNRKQTQTGETSLIPSVFTYGRTNKPEKLPGITKRFEI